MIAGMIQLEDSTLVWKLDSANQMVTYTVSDVHQGWEETLVVPGSDFMLALGIALDFNGGEGRFTPTEYERIAEATQPKGEDEPDADFTRTKARALRWIP